MPLTFILLYLRIPGVHEFIVTFVMQFVLYKSVVKKCFQFLDETFVPPSTTSIHDIRHLYTYQTNWLNVKKLSNKQIYLHVYISLS